MPRFTKLEREALSYVIGEVQAGDDAAYFNNGCDLPENEADYTAEHKKAIKLAEALSSASRKL